MYEETLPIRILLEEYKPLETGEKTNWANLRLREEQDKRIISVLSFEIYRKTLEEKLALKAMKKLYKAKRNKIN